jgi:hypothetical protein
MSRKCCPPHFQNRGAAPAGAEIQPPMSILYRYVEANQTINAGMVWNFEHELHLVKPLITRLKS